MQIVLLLERWGENFIYYLKVTLHTLVVIKERTKLFFIIYTVFLMRTYL